MPDKAKPKNKATRKKGSKKTSRRRFTQTDTYTISDLEQIKVLADPLRIRLLGAFCQERNTKQVADLIGEKPTKLYHHVDALERVGLIKLSRTRQNRGTLEKHYLAVARAFEAEADLFSQSDAGPQESEALQTTMSGFLDQAAREVRALFARGESKRLDEEGLLVHAEIHANEDEIQKVQEGLLELLKKMQEKSPPPEDMEKRSRYRLNIALIPLDPRKD